MSFRRTAEQFLAQAGVHIDGSESCDIRINRNKVPDEERLWKRALHDGLLAVGESYMDGWWDCDAIDQMVFRITRADLEGKLAIPPGCEASLGAAWLVNHLVPANPYKVAKQHYDLSNELFQAMLDKRMVYTCAYWKDADTLEEAQERKLDLVCRKLGLKPGMRVLDVGGGWGSFAKFAAQRYGVCVVNVTVSKEQAALADSLCSGLPVENLVMDYRHLPRSEKFDRIVSLGMFEHVGRQYYRTYFQVVHDCLKDGGLFLLHCIGCSATVPHPDPWITKYIFPNSAIPSIHQIGQAMERLFIVEDWHNFGQYYDPTLMEWHRRFEEAWPCLVKSIWGEIAAKFGCTERFYRMWRYYLLSCAGAFRARGPQLWQIVLSKDGLVSGYCAVR